MSTETKNLILRLELEPPNEILQKKALLELRETPALLASGLKELKALLEAEKDVINFYANDEWLLPFLRSCKCYPESARDLVKLFYSLRHKYSEINNLLLPSRLRHVFEANLVSILPQRDQEGRRIIVIDNGHRWDLKKVTQNEVFAASVLCTDLIHWEPATQINGVVYICDMDGLRFEHALKYTPYVTKRTLDFVQRENPLRVKGFHIINQPKIFQPIFAAIKPFISGKFSDRILMHGRNYESLHRHIAPECLPKCYGGKLDIEKTCSQETYQLLAKQEDEFKKLQTYGMKQ